MMHSTDQVSNLAPSATALTIAGSDPSGGAGLQADLKTFQQMGVYGMSVVTLITVQNTRQVDRVDVLDPQLVSEQLAAVVSDIRPHAIKTGALGNAATVRAICEPLSRIHSPKIIDPVLVSKHGHLLATQDVIQAFLELLVPQATLLTPNRFEAERLTGIKLTTPRDALDSAKMLLARGALNVLVKWGENAGQSLHILATQMGAMTLSAPRTVDANNTHGSGCVLAAAITATMALGETDIVRAVRTGLRCVHQAISCNTLLGSGVHPVDTRAIHLRAAHSDAWRLHEEVMS
jgi:hydroxymethylpyrimidine/phosphomethylpyrimidine kinase